MTKEEITAWALANGWQMIDDYPSLTKPAAPHPPIVRLVLKATIASVEIKKPAGKWEKVSQRKLLQNPARSRNRACRAGLAWAPFRA